MLHESPPDLVEGCEVLCPQADVVDAPTTEHWHLMICLDVADDLEYVQHGSVTDREVYLQRCPIGVAA